MLRLVPSQQAAIGRVETAIQQGVTWLTIVGLPDSGKSTLLAHWPGTQAASWLLLRAADVLTPEALAAACVAHWPSVQTRMQDLGWKTQLTQLHIPSRPGLPHLVIDDAEQLTPDLLAVVSAMTRGGFGVPWTVVLVGSPHLIAHIASACPDTVTPSTVRLPPWDTRDLLMVCPEAMSLPDAVREERLSKDPEAGISERLALLRAPLPEVSADPAVPESRPVWRRRWVWLVAALILSLALLVALNPPTPAVNESQRVPLPMTPR